ncbi:MAG TPA: Ig-like domain repeat protein, partial [Candidatus Sulfopaludibacter sp.]|nr:Ig-like domain repeat protein [Candidatus Sulfopaludibacter sp.]
TTGTFAINAAYTGDSSVSGSTGSLSVTTAAAPPPLTISITPSSLVPTAGQTVTFTVNVNGGPGGGTVTFTDGNTVLGTVNVVNGQATLTITGIVTGPHPITAVYNSGAGTVSAGVEVNVLPNRTGIVLLVSSTVPVCGQSVSYTAQVSGQAPAGVPAPTGTVQFFDGATPIGTGTITNGVVVLPSGLLHAGVHPITAVYQGDKYWYQAQSNVAPQTVAQETTTATATVLPDFSGSTGVTTYTANVTPGAPGACVVDGTVQFKDDKTGAILGTAQVQGGVAQVKVTPAADVYRSVSAVYLGTADTMSSNAPSVPQIAFVSAADFTSPHTTSDDIVTIFGSGLASGIVTPTSLQTTLGGATVKITDSAGVTSTGSLFYASPTQLNLVVPSGLALGPVTVSVTTAGGATYQFLTAATNVVPGLFSADSSGTGTAAAQILRVHADGSSAVENVATGPVDFGTTGDKLYLLLYGTGLRHALNSSTVTATVNGVSIPVLYSGSQPTFAGLDQVNLGPLPASLKGTGTVNVQIVVDGQPSNIVTVTFK